MPAGVVQLLLGKASVVSQALMDANEVRKISLTSSTRIGQMLMVEAAKTVKRFSMELSCHATVVICAYADVEAAVVQCANFKFRNAGQVRIAPSRFYVESNVPERFIARFKSGAEALRRRQPGCRRRCPSPVNEGRSRHRVCVERETQHGRHSRRYPREWSIGIETMTNYSARDVDEYISAAPEQARAHLKKVRAAIKAAVPEAEEEISWGKPYYKFHGMLGGFDAFKNHVSFEVWAEALKDEQRKALEELGYETGKRTFQIGYDQAVPTSAIKSLLKAQAKANQKGKSGR